MSSPATVLVTGAAGALGGAVTHAFLGVGFDVIGVDRADTVAEVRRSAGDRYTALRLDLGAEGAAAALAEAVATRQLAHVVGIAGGALPGEPETQDDPSLLSVDLFRASLDANLTTQHVAMHALWPALRAAPGDRSVTFVSSFNALSGQGMPAYSAAKAGLIGMMHALVDPLGRRGVRVNVLAPGTIRTPRTEALWGGVSDHFERLERSTALGRLGTPDDVARSCLALATSLTHMTGQVLVVDGGQTVVHR